MARARKKRDLLGIYERMLRVRLTELRLARLFAESEVPGFIHLSVGQEAVATGLGEVLGPEDTVASTHRGHGHALAKGIDLNDFFAELMGREDGICRGRGGSMHVADFSIGMLGANAIVGASIPIALGSALAHQVKGTNALAVAFFGDGAMAEGVFHESMNLAVLWQLPLLFVCENNGWSEFSPTSRQFVPALAKLSGAFGIPFKKVDGNDVLKVMDAAETAISRIRAGQGPQMLECVTQRWRGHYEGDPQKYRDPGELAELDRNDPLMMLRAHLVEGGISKEEISRVNNQIEESLEQAVEQARRAGAPDWSEASVQAYAKGWST